MERKKMGILGGTLDPVHLGHLSLLRMARVQLGLDEAVLLPSGDPPHKHCRAGKEDRLRMAHLAADGEFAVSEAEIARPGHTYTVDTLRALKRERPDWELIYLVGADTLPNLVTWREYREVFRLCAFAAARRGGRGGEIPEGARVHWLEGVPPDISSTQIRERAGVRKPLGELVPDSVERYIRERGLYLMAMREEEAVSILREMLSERRFRHSLGVRDEAERLARIYHLDPGAARVAGLLHDAAREMPLEGAEFSHAPAGAILAKERFGVRDAEILSAIRHHTLGRANMTGLELAIFVADFIEPNRADFPGLSDVRALAEKDLAAAAILSAELTDQHIRRLGMEPHPRTREITTQHGRDES